MRSTQTSINQILFREIKQQLYKYDCDEIEIDNFLHIKKDFLLRQQEAIQIIMNTMTAHGKQDLYQYVSELARVEHGIQVLEPWMRDHVVHSLLSFILGIYFNENFLSPSYNVNKLQWKLAGMFHDIGYPAEKAINIVKPLTRKVNKIKKRIGVNRKNVIAKMELTNLNILQNDIDSFNLIQKQLKDWTINIDPKFEYDNLVENGKIDHGMISALILLYVLDMMYEANNPEREFKQKIAPGTNIDFNQKYFVGDIVSACTAIFIHNLPKEAFNNTRIDRRRTPIAFLLKLSDCLQQWERPSLYNKTGYMATNFDISIQNNEIIFEAQIPQKEKIKMIEDISSILISPDVIVI